MTRDEFLATATAAAQKASATSGLPFEITVAQAALESNFGQSRLSREGNNYFGIKAHATCPDSIEMPSTEVVNGVTQHVTARFARYASMEACVADRDALILRRECYSTARAAAHDPAAFARALAAHWATDPNYASKLLKLAVQFFPQNSSGFTASADPEAKKPESIPA